MCIVACTLIAAGHTTGGVASADVTHAATEAYGISSDDTFVFTEVAECDAVLSAVACIEVERTQIDPGGTAHLLVHTEFGGDAFVPYGVTGIIDAAGYGLITDIDGITACLRNGGQIGGETLVTCMLHRLYLTHGASQERILSVEIESVVEGKTC